MFCCMPAGDYLAKPSTMTSQFVKYLKIQNLVFLSFFLEGGEDGFTSL